MQYDGIAGSVQLVQFYVVCSLTMFQTFRRRCAWRDNPLLIRFRGFGIVFVVILKPKNFQ